MERTPQFGRRLPGVVYRDRPGACSLIRDDHETLWLTHAEATDSLSHEIQCWPLVGWAT